jgi:hypothetical protein
MNGFDLFFDRRPIMKYMIQAVMLSVLLFVIPAGTAHAFVAWNWSFIGNGVTYGPDDTVFMYGRLFNQSTAGETIGNLGSGSDGEILGIEVHAFPSYNFSFGPESGSTFDAFETPLAAGTSRDFLLGREIPLNVHEGVYTQPAGIDLVTGLSEGNPQISRISNDYTWTVAEAHDPVVPEPSTLSLLAMGMGGLMFRKKFGRRK